MLDEEGDVLSVMLQEDGSEKNKESETNPKARNYGDEWRELCNLAERGLPYIQKHSVHLKLKDSKFRSIYWQLLLGSLPSSPPIWISILRQQRNSYRLLHQRLSVDPHQASAEDNPLSQCGSSIWNQYFCDKELRALIRQDVIRTFPNMNFFRSESVQSTMVNILFCYAREHPEICYRQGMHEVLAPLLFVLQEDQRSLLRAKEQAAVSDQAAEILDPAWLEEDAYWLFCKLMSHLAGNYRVKNVITLQTGYFPTSLNQSNRSSPGTAESELASRLGHIRDNLLPKFDKHLYQHLKNLDIPFQAFGIRWLRLLFGQEFPLQDLFLIWDAVFAEGDGLVDYIVVSMLSEIRDQLIVEDDTECLMLLMRYPLGTDVKSIIENALHMWKPKEYESKRKKSKEPTETNIILKKSSSQPNSISGRFKKFNIWSQKKDGPSVYQLPASNISPSVNSMEKPVTRLDRANGHQSVVEGFTLNDPMLARAELQHLHKLIYLVHSHLECHITTLERTLPSNTPTAGKAAIEGLKQLYIQLGHSLPATQNYGEVEAASEAQPAPRAEIASEVMKASSELSTKPKEVSCQLKDLKAYDGQVFLSYIPSDNPLRALCFESSRRNQLLHVSFCRVLGTCSI